MLDYRREPPFLWRFLQVFLKFLQNLGIEFAQIRWRVIGGGSLGLEGMHPVPELLVPQIIVYVMLVI